MNDDGLFQDLLRLREKQNALWLCDCLCSSRNIVDWGGKCSFFQIIHVRIDIRIVISISIRFMTTKIGKQVLLLQDLTRVRQRKQVQMTLRQDHVTN